MSNTHLHIPASKDTLFMRGFSCRQDIDQIRDFFNEKCGRNTVEFFKEDGNSQLFLALRFESKDVAKEVLHRFNDTEILGDRVTMTWYKDLRRARPYNDYRRQSYRGNYGSDQYDFRGSYQRSGYQRSHYRPTSSGRARRYSRSSSRSRSASRSPTQSRSRSRSTSRSYDSRDFKKKRDIVESGNRRRKSGIVKKRAVAEGNQGGYESSDSQNSNAVAGSGASPMKPMKKTNEAVDHQQQVASPKRMKPLSMAKVPQTPVEHEQSTLDLDQTIEGLDYVYESSPAKPRQGPKSSVQKKIPPKPEEKQSEWLPVDTQAVDSTPSAPAIKKFPQQVAQQPQNMAREPVMTQTKEVIPTMNKQQAALKKAQQAEERKVVSYEEERSDAEDMPSIVTFQQTHHPFTRADVAASAANAQPLTAQAGIRVANKSFTKEVAAIQNNSDPRMQAYDPMENDMNHLLRKRKIQEQDDDLETGMSDNGRQLQSFEDNKRLRREGREMQQGGGGGRWLMGLPHEKMILIKEKKEEIEKAYRQDCETFATVTKLLISKDTELEDRIQNSLRENLRDIGHRCIQELKDFVDKVKTEDDY